MPKRKRKTEAVTIDFSGVEVRKVPPVGDYLVKVEEVEQKDGTEVPYFAWKLKVEDGDHSGSIIYHNTSTSEKSLWALRKFFEAMGIEVPDGEMEIDLSAFVGETLGVTVVHEAYDGQDRARISDSFPASELEDEDDEDDDEEDEDEEEDDEDDDEDEEDEDEDEEDDDDDEDEEEEDEEEEEEDEDDDEEVAEEAKSASSKRLDEIIEEHDLPQKLKKTKPIAKKRKAVVKALEE